VTVTGAWNSAVMYRSSRSFESSGIGAPPANPAGTFPGFIRVQEYSPTFRHRSVTLFPAESTDFREPSDDAPAEGVIK
jgi:hypothetical protein